VLKIEGEIVVPVRAEPQQLLFGEVHKGEHPTLALTLTIAEPEHVKIASVDAEDKRLELTKKSEDGAGTVAYELRLKDTSKIERLLGKVHVAVTGADVADLDIAVNGDIVGDLRYPKQIVFTRAADKFSPRDVVFTSRSNRPIVLLGADDPDKVVKAEIVEPKGDKPSLRLSVIKTERGAEPTAKGKLRVRTKDKDEPTVEIEYTVHYDNLRPRPGVLSPRLRPGAPD